MMLNLAGYQETDQIYAGTRTLIYRAIQTTAEQFVIIKVLRNPHPNFNELIQFRNQYIIIRHLEHPTIVQPLTLERYGNGYALVMPDEGAISLWDDWQQSERSLMEFLTIAIQLAEALHYLGQQRIIHKDIKPANILIHPETGQVQLIDFSISSLLPKEQQQLTNANVLEGTLAYISPEQTGRMNRGIDYRTDFYSLGVTLYELLTGVLPFQSNDPVELLHCHIAKEPLAPNELLDTQGNPYPEAISEIILKLMAKNAEERYQSALGLRHDLEQCLQQWETSRAIENFQLGEHDRSDRFLIPEKLYGRETEVQSLLAAFDRVAHGTSEMMLVAGFSGIGKTAVVNEVHKPIVEKRGYFIRGKFDQFNRNVPFSAFVQAFRSLMGQLLGESDALLASWKEKILDAVGESGQVILEVIPELERIIGKQPTVPELSGSAAQNRFNLLFSKFVQVFTTKDHPLVIFLDDLQWIDSASLKLLKLLLNESEAGYLLVLGAYRDNEVFPAHPLMLALDEMLQEKTIISTLTLPPLAELDINHLVADTLLCSTATAAPLSELVHQKTQGNPFFTTQFLLGLHGEGYIVFDPPRLPFSKRGSQGGWQCDLTQVQQLALTDDVVEFMVGRLQKLPEATQNILKIAACIGNQFDLATLAVVCEQSQEEVATDLWHSLQEGLVIPETQTYKFFQGDNCEVETANNITVGYRFLHDRVQQAAYFLIDAALKPETHLKIGRLLLNNLSASAIEDAIFNLTNQLNKGQSLINDRHEKDELARLNLIAARKAKASTAYLASIDYLNSGIKLLEDGWYRQYNLTLSIYLEAIESEYISTNFECSKALADLALEQVKSLLDRLKVHELQIQYYIAKNQRKKAVELGLDALKLLNIELDGVSPEVTDIEALADLPEMIDPYKITTLQILITIVSAAVVVAPELLIPIAFKLVNICIHSGNSRLSAYAYGFHAWMLCSSVGEIDAGYRFGKLAIQLLEKFNAKEIKCKVYQQFNVFVRHRKEPLEAMKELVKAVQSGIEVGDIEYACYAAQDYCILQFFLGENLEISLQEQEKYWKLICHNQQEFSIDFTSPWLQLVSNLLNQSVDRCSLNGAFFDETEKIPALKHINDSISLFPILFIKTYLNYLFGCYEIAVENATYAEKIKTGSNGFIYYPVYLFYFSLALLACCLKSANEEQKNFIDRVNYNQKTLGCWMSHAPFTYQHKYDLVQAEYHRVSGEKLAAIDLYDRAISGAKANEFIQEEALANELAAKFYLNWGKEKIAATYMQEAYYCYSRWGAKAKTDDLEQRYPQLLQSILQRTTQIFNPLESLSLVNSQISAHSSTKASTSASTSINHTLDFAAVLKTSQALSSIIKLDELLCQLTQIILQHSGGDRCALILPNRNDQWFVEAVATTDTTNLYSIPLENNLDFPIKLIQYVKNTQAAVVIDDLDTDLPIIDDYLNQQQPKSVLCLPILNQSQLIGILYLSNQSTSGVFTSDRILILNFLCTQAAISLQNARLYQAVEDGNTLLNSLLQTLPDLFFAKNLQGQYIAANENVNQLFGQPIGGIVGKTDFDIFPLEVAEAIIPKDREIITKGVTERFEEVIPKNKEDCTYLTIKTPLRDAQGKVIGLIGLSQDISDRKAAEAALQQENQERKRVEVALQTLNQKLNIQNEVLIHLAKSSALNQGDLSTALREITAATATTINIERVSVWLYNSTRTYIECLDLYELTSNQHSQGLKLSIADYPSYFEALAKDEPILADDAYTDPRTHEFSESYLTPLGISSMLDIPIALGGQTLGVLCIEHVGSAHRWLPQEENFACSIADLVSLGLEAHDRKRIETKLRLSEARATAVFDQAAVGFVESDMQTGKLTLVNPCFCQMTGYTTAELMEMAMPELTHPEDLPGSVQAIQQLYSGQVESFTLEKRYIRKDGSYFWAQTTVYLVELLEGESTNCLAIVQDISERKRLEAERQQAETVLQNLVLGTAATTGQDFFPVLVKHIATALNVSYVMVTEKVDDTLQTLAFWSNGALQPTYTYNLAHTPCELVLRDGEWYGECSMQEQFPKDLDLVEMGVESYLGTAFYSTEGRVIGHLCILNTQTIQDLKQAQYLLRIFAARAAAELERQRAMNSLEHLNQALEIKVKERTKALAMTQAAVDWAADCVFLIRPDGSFYYANNTACAKLGYSPEELQALSVIDINPTVSPERWVNIWQAIKQEPIWTLESLHQSKDARIYPVEINARYLEFDGEEYSFAFVRDITERKQNEQIIRQQTEREKLLREIAQKISQSLELQKIFDAACVGIREFMQADRVAIFKFDPDSDYDDGTFVAESVRVGFDSVLAQRVHDHSFGENYAQLYFQGKYLAIDDIYNQELSHCYIDILEQFQVRANLVIPVSLQQHLWGLLCIHQCAKARHWQEDQVNLSQQLANQLAIAIQQAYLFEQLQQQLIELEQAQQLLTKRNQQLAVSNRELAHATRLKDEFLANMSHELRTPLNGILGYTQIFKQDSRLDSKQLKGIQTIHQCGIYLLDLIEDVLDLSKIEAQKMELYPGEIHFPTFLNGILDLCRHKAEQKGLSFIAQVPLQLPSIIYADIKRLRQILINLLSNAIKFTHVGSVRVSIEILAQQEKQQTGFSHATLRFQVEDTGVGISSEDIKKIFLAFEQVGNPAQKQEGTGLGLAISRKLLALMDAKLEVTSQLGEGSTFWFDVSIPACWTKNEQPFNLQSNAIIGYQGHTRKILAIDDIQETLEIIDHILTPLGFELIVADNGREGLAIALEQTPDLILCDLKMPMMDGFEMMRQLRRHQEFQQLPIIVFSASAYNRDRLESEACGATDFLAKPLVIEQLLEKLENHLHLEWIYQNNSVETFIVQEKFIHPKMAIPEQDILAKIYQLAQAGLFFEIEEQLEYLGENNKIFIPFCQQIEVLIDQFDSEKIKLFLKKYLP